jgi:hypothetical protein
MTAKIKSQTHSHRSGHKHKPRGLSDKKFASVYWPYIPMVLLAGLLLIFTSYNGVLASVIRHPTSKVLGYATGLSASQLLAETNAARQSNSVKPLTINDQLAQAAQAKANDMAARDYWSHQTPQGNPPWVFAQAQGYTYQKLGENLATGFSGPQATIDGWMASTEHRNNMLDNAYSQVGFGYANNPNYTAAGGGPMTIIVAFYGQPVGISDAANNQLVGSLANSGGTPTSYLPTKVATTTRAQLAFAHTPLSPYATLISLCALMLVAGIWIGRHVWKLRRVLVQGESYIIHHPMMDVGLLMIGFAFFALSKTAGLIQ